MAYAAPKLQKIFSLSETPAFTIEELHQAAAEGRIPALTGRRKSSWTSDQLPRIGEAFGFLRKPSRPLVVTSFITKGGVLKSTLVLNLARMAALHNIRTCVVGLDMQGDITAALGCNPEVDSSEDLEEAIQKLSSIRGIPDILFQKSSPLELLIGTDLPNLSLIPETPELVALEQSLTLRNRREYWLRDNVLEPLKSQFDLILLDASPNWNQLITNALTASDLLISPLECKINNFRNLKMFESFVSEFKKDLDLQFEHVYVPTRYSEHRKLSREIFQWYCDNLENCLPHPIKEGVVGEEASALNLSIPEYAPSAPMTLEMNQLLKKIWSLPVFGIKNESTSQNLNLEI